MTEMRRALSQLSSGAEDHLSRHRRTSPANDPIDANQLRQLVHQFAFENRLGFQNLPAKTKAGRVENLPEKALIREFNQAFKAGHRGVNARTGWPDFLNLCRDPLVRPDRLNLLRDLGAKSLQDKTRRRNNRGKKRGN
jgi:hypothetical protein